MNTLQDVKAKVRALLGDPDGDWVTDAYILPLINVTYNLQYLYLKNATGKNLERTVLCLGVQPGTNSLYPLQAGGEPLAGLYTPLEVWTKPAGAPANYFTEALEREDLPHVALPGVQPVQFGPRAYWRWQGNQLQLTPIAIALDIEVTGRFNPPPLAKDQDVLIVSPDMEAVTAAGTAAVGGVERSNPAILEGYAQMAEAGLDDIAAELIRQKQGTLVRTGRMSRSTGYYGWAWR